MRGLKRQSKISPKSQSTKYSYKALNLPPMRHRSGQFTHTKSRDALGWPGDKEMGPPPASMMGV